MEGNFHFVKCEIRTHDCQIQRQTCWPLHYRVTELPRENFSWVIIVSCVIVSCSSNPGKTGNRSLFEGFSKFPPWMISHLLILDTTITILSPPTEFGPGHATSTSLIVKKEGCIIWGVKTWLMKGTVHSTSHCPMATLYWKSKTHSQFLDIWCIFDRQTTFHLEDCPKPMSFFVNPV